MYCLLPIISGTPRRLAVQFMITWFVALSFAKTEVPVFLFSGQSNMVGMGSVNGLSSEQKETVSNVMINADADCDPSKKSKWLPLGPGFGNGSSNFGPELLFGITLADSMPDQKIAFIKNAVNGAPLGSSTGYLPPSSNNGTGGNNYRNMMDHIERAMESFHEAFDTSEYTPRWAGFIWLQGESDAMQGGSLANDYENNLENLISDIREMCETPDLPVILPLISKSSYWTEADKIRGADVALRESLENIDTVETKHLNLLQDNMHYDADAQIEIGYWSAIRWLGLEYDYRDPVPMVKQEQDFSHLSGSPSQRATTWSVQLFDLSGRCFPKSNYQSCIAPVLLIRKREYSSHGKGSEKSVIIR